MNELILASASPRRRELLERLGLPFTVVTADVDESVPEDTDPGDAVLEIAARKAQAVRAENPRSVVLAADTVVYHRGRMLGKPAGLSEAVDMLRSLSGAIHEVYTGVWVLAEGQSDYLVEKTLVEFFPLSEEEIFSYIESGEPFDKAGAYGIQGLGALLVKGIEGDFYNVMGLPIGRVSRILRKMCGKRTSR